MCGMRFFPLVNQKLIFLLCGAGISIAIAIANNNNNNESLFDQKIKTHILCYNIN